MTQAHPRIHSSQPATPLTDFLAGEVQTAAMDRDGAYVRIAKLCELVAAVNVNSQLVQPDFTGPLVSPTVSVEKLMEGGQIDSVGIASLAKAGLIVPAGEQYRINADALAERCTVTGAYALGDTENWQGELTPAMIKSLAAAKAVTVDDKGELTSRNTLKLYAHALAEQRGQAPHR